MARRRKKYRTTKNYTNKMLNNVEQPTTFFNQKVDHSTLAYLVGKKVKINRGGPNSKEGILFSVKEDYVALLVEKEILYFTNKHIHSITQNIKEGSSVMAEQNKNEIECSYAETFSDMLSEYMYQNVQINNGPETRKGILLNFNETMISILHEEDGVIFYNMDHVKLIKADPKSNDEGEENTNNTGKYSRTDYQKYFGIIHQWNTEYDFQLGADCFADLIQTFKHKWVSINRSGPEALEGVLIDEGGGFFTIVNNEEAIHLQSFHIKNISEGAKGSFKAAKENDGKESHEGEHSYSYEGDLQYSSELSDIENCSCEESYYEESVENGIWKSSHEVNTYDVFN